MGGGNLATYTRKKGFTLIELLAVIVILAVIALIATPIIMNVINDAKKGAAKDSMYSYMKAVELAITQQLKPDTDLLSGTYIVKEGNLYNGSTKVLDVELKGTKPVDGIGSIMLEKSLIKKADLKFNNYQVVYNGQIAEEKNNSVYVVGEEIYYNPETNKKCTAGDVNTVANAKTGCLKWNVITMGDTTSKEKVEIMLNHNTTGKVAWNSTGENADGMKEVVTALKTDVASWNASVTSTARLISGQEVADIGKDSAWNVGKYTGTIYSSQSWLYQNLSSGNTNEKPYGYWTSSAHSSAASYAWNVNYVGYLSKDSRVDDASYRGVRPVITISKSIIS